MAVSTMKECQAIRKRLSKAKTELKTKHSSLKGSIDGIEKTRDKLDSKKAELKKKIDKGKREKRCFSNLSPFRMRHNDPND